MARRFPIPARSFSTASMTAARCGSTASAIKNITEHPAFRNTARMVARLYDALHRDHAEKKIC